ELHVGHETVGVCGRSLNSDVRRSDEGSVIDRIGDTDGRRGVPDSRRGTRIREPAADTTGVPGSKFQIEVNVIGLEMHHGIHADGGWRTGIHSLGPRVPISVSKGAVVRGRSVGPFSIGRTE